VTSTSDLINELVSEVSDACVEVVNKSDETRERPERLYHFTDAEGFTGIITSRCLWSSLATALNDAEEVRHGMEIMKAIVANRLAKAATPYDRALADCLDDPTRNLFGVSYHVSAFVISFCGRCDKASQWFHYCRSGTGVALGFATELDEVLKRDLARIDYDRVSQTSRLERLIDAGRSVLARATAPKPWMPEVAAHLVSILTPALAARMKHPSFEDEEEWRLVGLDVRQDGKPLTPPPASGGLKWRRTGPALVPYEELSFAHRLEALEEVVVGYSSPLGLDAVRLLLSEQGMRPSVRRSDVPVR
jgi:hypothetical protein